MSILLFFLKISVAIVVIALVLVLSQDVQIFPGFLQARLYGTVSASDVPQDIESKFLVTTDDESIEVWRLAANDGSKKYAAILCHGNGDTVKTFYHVQQWLSQHNIESFSFDYRGYGRSSGWPGEKGIYLDSDAVLEYVVSRGYQPDSIIVIGASLGSGIAARLAAKNDVRMLMLWAPYTSLPAVVGDRKLIKGLKNFLWYEFPTKKYVEQLSKTELVIVHGIRDNVIKVWHSKDIENSYKGSYQVSSYYAADAGHNDIYDLSKDWLSQRLDALQLANEGSQSR